MVEEGKQEGACRDSCRPLKFRIGDREKSCDRISELPDALLLHILSFLSVDDAVLTSLLCRRWRNLWRWMDCLDFPMPCGNLKRNSVHFIGKALALHEGLKIKRFCARFYYNSKYSSNVDSWVHLQLLEMLRSLFWISFPWRMSHSLMCCPAASTRLDPCASWS
ncbi:hypothetical protein HPP92_015647 [Vanilla planifolia]|uniref:F-box domain-containing protein n=1 Tax=Vanilla planifolia TaxID=51239 RepID=A0A835UTG5_VANPL|nr:hypothetical protein HPP92_016298 [Vanilla planifolia]KAG0471101.1 hypothetical protein HPP92_015647 [Vanilla planifolia]